MRKRSSNDETLGSAKDDAARKEVGNAIRRENRTRARRARSTDENELAASIVAQSTGKADEMPVPDAEAISAVMRAMGRGGLKGGRARAASLTPRVRKTVKKAATKLGG